jgi:serine/threonine-protein kinase
VRGAFEALAQVHEATDVDDEPLGIVHGDLSPANILVSAEATSVKLIDFGLAIWRHRPSQLGGAFRGTAAYAAPGVARGEPFDARADLFALAASLLHVASGEPPRSGATMPSLLLSAGEEPIDAWAERAARGLPLPLARALVQCVAFDARLRPESARDVLRGT